MDGEGAADDDPALGEPLWTDTPEPSARPAPDAAAARAATRLRGLAMQPGNLAFLPGGEVVHVDRRRHPVVLLPAALRTVAGLGLLVAGGGAAEAVVLGVLTAWWALLRLDRGLRTALLVGALTVPALLAVAGRAPAVAALLLAAWTAEDVATWWQDRVVITSTRLYHRHGWLTRHAPSVALASALFLDASETPLERLLGCGTLRLDSAARRDRPLILFTLLPDAREVLHTLLRLRHELPAR